MSLVLDNVADFGDDPLRRSVVVLLVKTLQPGRFHGYDTLTATEKRAVDHMITAGLIEIKFDLEFSYTLKRRRSSSTNRVAHRFIYLAFGPSWLDIARRQAIRDASDDDAAMSERFVNIEYCLGSYLFEVRLTVEGELARDDLLKDRNIEFVVGFALKGIGPKMLCRLSDLELMGRRPIAEIRNSAVAVSNTIVNASASVGDVNVQPVIQNNIDLSSFEPLLATMKPPAGQVQTPVVPVWKPETTPIGDAKSSTSGEPKVVSETVRSIAEKLSDGQRNVLELIFRNGPLTAAKIQEMSRNAGTPGNRSTPGELSRMVPALLIASAERQRNSDGYCLTGAGKEVCDFLFGE